MASFLGPAIAASLAQRVANPGSASLVTGQAQSNLSGDQLTQLRDLANTGNYSSGYQGSDGLMYGATGVVASGEDAGNPSQLLGYEAYDPAHIGDGQQYNLYGTDGSFAGARTVDNGKYAGWWAPLAAVGAGAALGASGAGAGAAGAAGADAGAAGAVASPVASGAVAGTDLGALGAGGSAAGAGTGFGAGAATGADMDAFYGGLDGGATLGGGGSMAGAGMNAALTGTAGAASSGAAGSSGSFLPSTIGGMPTSTALPMAGNLLSGLLGAGAAKSAAGAQANAANNALTMQQGMFNTQVGLESPFRQAGVDATGALKYGLGLSTDGGPGAAAAGVGYGSLIRPFSNADFQEDPGIQFQTQQGNLALQNSQAAKDGVLSGAALKDLIGYNSGMAATGYQSAYDRYVQNQKTQIGALSGVANTGQAAASNTANNAGNMANAMSSNITGIGNAQASGTVGASNALSSGINGAGNYYLLSSLLKQQQNQNQQGQGQASATGGYN